MNKDKNNGRAAAITNCLNTGVVLVDSYILIQKKITKYVAIAINTSHG